MNTAFLVSTTTNGAAEGAAVDVATAAAGGVKDDDDDDVVFCIMRQGQLNAAGLLCCFPCDRWGWELCFIVAGLTFKANQIKLCCSSFLTSLVSLSFIRPSNSVGLLLV